MTPEAERLDLAELDVLVPPEDPGVRAKAYHLPEQITQGDRHAEMFKLFRSLKAKGLSFDAAVTACNVENTQKCKPPLEAKQLEYRRWWDAPDHPGFSEQRAKDDKRANTYNGLVDKLANYEKAKHEARERFAAERRGPVPDLRAMSLAEMADYQFPARRPLLYRGEAVVFREGHIGQIYAERGIGKSWLVNTLAFVAAFGIDALGFRNPAPCRVLVVDGEMASEEIQERSANLCRFLNVPAVCPGALTIVAADWQESYLPRLDTTEGQAAIEPHVADADLIILDNRSCLFDPEGEKDPSAWQPAQDYLLELRRRGKAVLLAHHSNRQGGARGISKAEDPMNLLLKLARPDDYTQDQGARFVVTFDKTRGIYGLAAAPFIATLTPTGWKVEPVDGAEEDGVATKLREYLRAAAQVNERPRSASAAVTAARINRSKGFEAWAALVKRGEIVEHPEGGFHVVEVKDEPQPF